ncbi:MAG: ABC transporter permease [Candidatus Manganitrophus sp.]|nr:ABC transporter permease [Candidatus Manganitrophus sp.]MDC4224653.1 ABC transporter permease [Candidatus Manganitrophus sp.]WDT70245.1 MAG: ABC transporter permease [Candidatus Manganitrophus sp.]WDT78103.1 MAG: ABC transporter permease [Candidatus Manganitrophus sp.]
MAHFLFQRFWQLLITLFGITLLTFGIMHLAPGDPTDLQTTLNPKVSAQAKENLRRLYGLDRPLHIQYLDWLRRFVTLDLGRSFVDGEPVSRKILERLPVTVTINLLTLAVIVLVAFPIGILSATRQYSWMDKATTLFVYIGFSLPSFWLALLLMLLFGVYLGWLPLSGYQSLTAAQLSPLERLIDWARHLILPVLTASLISLAGYSRYLRSEMLEVIRQDYIQTARAKGLSERQVIYKHALRNALIPVVTLMGLELPTLIGGSVIIETIFAIPGIGQLSFQSVLARDYPVIMGLTVFAAALTLIGNLLADLSYAWVNPRIRIS